MTGRDDTDSSTSTSKKLVMTFILSWLTQFLVYSLRKPIGVLKIYIGNAMNLTNSQMGVFDIRYYKITSTLDFVIFYLEKIVNMDQCVTYCAFAWKTMRERPFAFLEFTRDIITHHHLLLFPQKCHAENHDGSGQKFLLTSDSIWP